MDGNIGVNSKCQKEYLERINKVLEYIENNLGTKLPLHTLANVAGFSPFHFHRIFHSIVGETVQEYVKSMRLALAARKLLYSPNLSITDLALDCGFSAQSDFARSFKSKYGVSASKFIKAKRDKDKEVCILKRVEVLPEPRENKAEYFKNVKVIELPDFNIAYIRNVGLSKVYKSTKIEKSYGRLFRWAKTRDIMNKDTIILGLTLDNPEITPLEKCRYDSCITVPEGICPDGEIGVRTINSEGKYAAYTFNNIGPEFYKTFFDTTAFIYGWWIPENGYLPDDKPFLEIYSIEEVSNTISMDFCLPVKPY